MGGVLGATLQRPHDHGFDAGIVKVRELATAEFATLRLRLLKIAARVVETTSRIRLAFAAACPEADLIRCLPGALLPLGPWPAGRAPPFALPIPQASALQSTGRQAVKAEGSPMRLVRGDVRPHQSDQKPHSYE
ncbi:hypothetical protein ABIB80_001537 [Bradyrhizobium sp. i1.15.2]